MGANRTGLDAATLARSLRTAAGDGSIEWVSQPIQTSVLLDIADMLDEREGLREERDTYRDSVGLMDHPDINHQLKDENAKLRELVSRADTLMQGVLDNATDTVVVSDLPCCDTLFDNLCDYRLKMLKLGFELSDARISELRELGIEVD
jgi:hypothetical protein